MDSKFGDKMTKKEDQVTRIITVQVNSFSTSTSDNDVIKRNALRNLISESETDVVLTQEDNRYWLTVHTKHQLNELATVTV